MRPRAKADDGGFIERGLVHDKRQTRVPGTERQEVAADRLRSLVERIERIETERRDLGGDIRDLYAEVKSAGFDVPAVKRLIAERKHDPKEVEAQLDLLDVYRRALG